MGPNHETNCVGGAADLVLMKRLAEVTELAGFAGSCRKLWKVDSAWGRTQTIALFHSQLSHGGVGARNDSTEI